MKIGYFTKIHLQKLGLIWIAATKDGICKINFGGSRQKFISSLDTKIKWREARKPFLKVLSKLKLFVEGKKIKFPEKLDSAGTAFQKKIWKKISAIPRSETRSYAWLAAAVGKPKACRAAANACGANPVPIMIPCHRVINSDGKPGGFSSGIKIKIRLLKLENPELSSL